jgi:hypothetical protein
LIITGKTYKLIRILIIQISIKDVVLLSRKTRE